jgi:hypothetical protein
LAQNTDVLARKPERRDCMSIVGILIVILLVLLVLYLARRVI